MIRMLASKSGRLRARKLAQDRANAAGRKVYLQMDELPYPSNEMDVMIADDGRGPFWSGMCWCEFFPIDQLAPDGTSAPANRAWALVNFLTGRFS